MTSTELKKYAELSAELLVKNELLDSLERLIDSLDNNDSSDIVLVDYNKVTNELDSLRAHVRQLFEKHSDLFMEVHDEIWSTNNSSSQAEILSLHIQRGFSRKQVSLILGMEYDAINKRVMRFYKELDCR
jgi:DNA-directed RNA polymerase specialized sigma24 family protein